MARFRLTHEIDGRCFVGANREMAVVFCNEIVAAGWSKRRAARELDVGLPTVCRFFEAYRNGPRPNIVIHVAKKFGFQVAMVW